MRSKSRWHGFSAVVVVEPWKRILGVSVGRLRPKSFVSERAARDYADNMLRSTGIQPLIVWARIEIETGVITSVQPIDPEPVKVELTE